MASRINFWKDINTKDEEYFGKAVILSIDNVKKTNLSSDIS